MKKTPCSASVVPAAISAVTSEIEAVPASTGNKNAEFTEIANDNNGIPVFRVQIAAYKNEVPPKALEGFVKVKDAGITHLTGKDQLSLFFLGGNLKTYADAQLMKKLAIESGISDAFITAFYSGNKITVTQAIGLLKK